MRRLLLALTVTLATSAAAQAADLKKVVVAGGCFWCVESDFDKVDGVTETISGYAGGTTADPTYKQVVKGGAVLRPGSQLYHCGLRGRRG